MRSGAHEVSVNTHERDETDLTEVSVSLVQTQNGHILDLADDIFLHVAEQHRGRIRGSHRRRHRLVDDVGVSQNRIRCVHRQAGHPNRTTVLVEQLLDDLQRRVVEHVLRATSVRRRFTSCTLRTSCCRSLQPHWNQ